MIIIVDLKMIILVTESKVRWSSSISVDCIDINALLQSIACIMLSQSSDVDSEDGKLSQIIMAFNAKSRPKGYHVALRRENIRTHYANPKNGLIVILSVSKRREYCAANGIVFNGIESSQPITINSMTSMSFQALSNAHDQPPSYESLTT